MLAYGKSAGVHSQEAQSSLRRWLDDVAWEEAELRLLAIPDSSYLTIPMGERVQLMEVDVGRFKDLLGRSIRISEPPLRTLRKTGDADFKLGSVVFPISVTSKVGLASVAISIWADRRPVDELKIDLCVVATENESCSGSPRPTIGLEGLSSLRADPNAIPDLALHVLELGEDDAVGVLHCTACGWAESKFLTWDVGESVGGLERHLEKTLVPELQAAARIRNERSKKQQFQNLGQALIGMLFGDPLNTEARRAERSFLDAARDLRSLTAAPGASTSAIPSLFVRMLPRSRTAPFLAFPLGLGYVPAKADKPSFFLGEAFSVEMALPVYDYSEPAGGCVPDWIVLAPPLEALSLGNSSHKPLYEALKPISHLMDRFETASAETHSGSTELFATPADLAKWFGESELEEGTPTVILTISHHKRNALYFTEERKQGVLVSSNIRRALGRPSAAIILGCGTGAPGASEIVKELNLAGVATVLMTSTEVKGKIAGDLLARVFERLDQRRADANYGIGHALVETSRELFTLYGPEVLTFVVAGNSRLRVCPPNEPNNALNSAEGDQQ